MNRIKWYRHRQIEVLLKYLKDIVPQWLLLGGPADSDEAQTAIQLWPNIKVIGVEANHKAIQWQLENGWPKDHPLLHHALWGSVGTNQVIDPGENLHHATVGLGNPFGRTGIISDVTTTTLDHLNSIYGPFQDAILWLDIEGTELQALQGATNLLATNSILIACIEMTERMQNSNDTINQILMDHKFRHVGVHNYYNKIYMRKRIHVKS